MIKNYLSIAFVLLAAGIPAFAQGTPPDSAVKPILAPDFVIAAEDETAGIDGVIKVAVDINRSGDAIRAVVYVGPSWPCSVKLDDRVNAVMRDAEKAVLKFKFAPAIKNGKPVDTRVGISLTIGKTARKKKEGDKPADPNATKPKLVTGGVVNGKALSLPKPEYPFEAKQVHAGGTVSVQVLIGEDGKVISAQAISGSPLFMFASRRAACGAKFSPTLLVGNPVKVSGVITYNFVP